MAVAATRVVERNLRVFRRLWRGTVLVTLFAPIGFLAAMGLGLGGLVNRGSGGVGGVSYLEFLAPGLLAATAMQTAAAEGMYPILGKILWDRTYEAMLATPLSVRDLLAGELSWMTLRLTFTTAIFFGVMLAFGIVRTPEAAFAIPAAVLTGLAFATPIMAFTATRKNDSGFSVVMRFVVTPLFLFGGAFFPIARLPLALQVVAWLTPLAHGVALCRGVVLANIGLGDAVEHVTVLVAYAIGGVVFARVYFMKRLVK